MADRLLYHAVLPVPLALLHHLPDHLQGDGQREVDGAVGAAAHSAGAGAVPVPDGGGAADGNRKKKRRRVLHPAVVCYSRCPLGSIFCSWVRTHSSIPVASTKVDTAGDTSAWPAAMAMAKPASVQYSSVQ